MGAGRDQVGTHRFAQREHPLDEAGDVGDSVADPVMRRADNLLREMGAEVVGFGLTAIEPELNDLTAIADQYAAALAV